MGDNSVLLNEMAEDAGGGAPGDAATTNAIGAVVQNWGAHPYTLGAYSYPMVGTYTTATNNKRAALQVPVANNRIFFAGEGTHVTHPATVVGALHEGERAAHDVHAVNGNPNNPPPLPGATTMSVASILAQVIGEGGGKKRPRAAGEMPPPFFFTLKNCPFFIKGSSWPKGHGRRTFEVDPEMQEYTSILVLPTLGRGEEAHQWNYAVTDANDLTIRIESALSDQAGELSEP